MAPGAAAQTSTPVPSPTPTATATPYWTATPAYTANPTMVAQMTRIASIGTSGNATEAMSDSLSGLKALVNSMMVFYSMAEYHFDNEVDKLANDYCIVISLLSGKISPEADEPLFGAYLTNTILALLLAIVFVLVIRFIIWIIATAKSVLTIL